MSTLWMHIWQRPLGREITVVLIAKVVLLAALKITVFSEPASRDIDGERIAEDIFNAAGVQR